MLPLEGIVVLWDPSWFPRERVVKDTKTGPSLRSGFLFYCVISSSHNCTPTMMPSALCHYPGSPHQN